MGFTARVGRRSVNDNTAAGNEQRSQSGVKNEKKKVPAAESQLVSKEVKPRQ